jgi:two-component system, OmpR family, sensor histidine kinase QseC
VTGSIRRRLMLLVLASVTLVWGITLVTSYRQATHEVDEWEDTRLEQAARTLLLVDTVDLATLAKFGFGSSDDDGDDELSHRLSFEVRAPDGHLVAASPGLPLLGPANLLSSQTVAGSQTLRLGKLAWNTYTLHDPLRKLSVRVYERSDRRSDLATGVARRVARPLAYALPVLALLVWVSIGSSLAPLRTLSTAIRTRNADNLDSIDMRRAPAEVRPLVDALNHLLMRLKKSIDRERAFTSDAAHELKTPLAAIKVQAQVALGTQNPAQQRLAMQRVVEGVDRSTHLANQLLLLARLDEADQIPGSPVELNTVALQSIATRTVDATRKRLTLSLLDDAPCTVHADPILLRILLDNLIDNAIKYSDAGGRIEVVVRRQSESTLLSVRDNGPGVTTADQARLSDRFFRVVGSSQSGSGLGLSIVARIAARFDAQLSFAGGIDQRGLRVNVNFPSNETLRTN